MADAPLNQSEAPRETLWFCHQCVCRISSITTEFKCINCNSGFVEEISAEQSSNNNANNEGFSIFEASNDSSADNILDLINEISLISNNPSTINPARISRFLNSFMASQANGPFVRVLHGNPEDYVFSTEGLDTVITQLLNQIDSSGPPPMSQEQMENLNEVTINNEHVNTNLQCSICMEDFVLDEKVKELECGHLYHNDCIIEWLKLHATCAICRTVFENKNSNTSSSTNRQQETSRATTSTTSTTSNSNNHKPTDYDYDFTDDLD